MNLAVFLFGRQWRGSAKFKKNRRLIDWNHPVKTYVQKTHAICLQKKIAMNALNLRVSSVKTGENVRKNAEMRTSMVVLPLEYRETLKSCGQEEFLNAKNIQEQVEAVKRFTLTNENPDLLQFIADLYFMSPLKNPVRNQISR